jgi:hypothetical protein
VIRRALGPITVLVVTACAETTIDTTATTSATSASATTVFDPAGTTAEQLARLEQEVGALSALIIDNEGQDQALVRIEALWAPAREHIEAERPELLAGFDTVIDLVRISVARRRPADADKARKNLTVLVAAYNE